MPQRIWTLAMVLIVLLAPCMGSADVPDIAFNTIIPGYFLSSGQGLVVDGAGNSFVYAKHYLDGRTLDILVAKLGPEGQHLWTSLIPGSAHDWAAGIILDPAGDLWLTGWTSSPDFPVTSGALDQTLTGFRDAFILNLSADDGSVLYCTLLGGDYTDEGRAIALDASGNILIAGCTWSTDFPVLDPIQAVPNGYPYQTSDLFLTRITPDGSAILQSTYLGGSLDDELRGMAVDHLGRIWIAGTTLSGDLPLLDPLQAQMNSGGDCFVQRFDAAASALEFGTYFGGSDIDYLGGVGVGSAGDLFITGTTRSVDFPTTAGSLQDTFVGAVNGCETFLGGFLNCEDMWAARISSSGDLVYSTFLGGTNVEECRGIAVDPSGRAHLVGYTTSTDFPPDGTSGSANIVALGLSPMGSEIEYRSAVRSGSANAGHGIALGPQGSIFVTGALGVPADVFVARLIPTKVTGVPSTRDPSLARIASIAPNPFNPRTLVTFVLPEAALTRLEIFDGRGRLVRTLVAEMRIGGGHKVLWDGMDDRGRQASSGIYHARLQAGPMSDVKRLVMIR